MSLPACWGTIKNVLGLARCLGRSLNYHRTTLTSSLLASPSVPPLALVFSPLLSLVRFELYMPTLFVEWRARSATSIKTKTRGHRPRVQPTSCIDVFAERSFLSPFTKESRVNTSHDIFLMFSTTKSHNEFPWWTRTHMRIHRCAQMSQTRETTSHKHQGEGCQQ